MSAHFPKQQHKKSSDWRKLIDDHSPYLAANLQDYRDIPFDDVLKQAEKQLLKSTDTEEVMAILRRAKKNIATLTAINDLKGEWNDLTVMAKLSAFADFCMRHALRHLLEKARQEKKIKSVTPDNCGVSIIALGKWGPHELNYSSDIDLMVVFDHKKSALYDKDDTQNFFIRLTKDLSRIFDQPTQDGYVFRTDLRLRPDPGAMPLAISIATAENYYGKLGQNWERAAMIKARPVTGDVAVGTAFMKILRGWIWRKNLDFAAIQDIHSIKRQINAAQKKKGGAFNVKLGHGGIREIEFFVQTQQLVYGGREPRLRAPDTLTALAVLAETGHITKKKQQQLAESYLFLRRTEHRLQMQEDRQTHTLPEKDLGGFAAFMEYPSAAAFMKDLEKHTAVVKSLYADLFTESPSLSGPGNLVFTGIEDDPETLETLRKMGFGHPEKVTAAVRGWHHGRYRAMQSERARQVLTEIVPQLLGALARTPHPDEAFTLFDRFLERTPSGVPLFSMFEQNRQMMELVADIMGISPAMAERLGARPEVLQGVLSPDFFGDLPHLDTLMKELNNQLSVAQDYQDALNLTRRFARERRFHAGVHILRRLTSPQQAGRYISDIAEACILCLLPHVEREFAKTHGKFGSGRLAVVAMGGFAAQYLAVDSDLDIVAVYDVSPKEKTSTGPKPLPPNAYYIKLMQLLLSALSAPTEEGVLYEVDTRLRPAGHDGPLAVSLKGFADYHHEHAWTWERMSLISSRVICPDKTLTKKLNETIMSVITQPGNKEKLRRDVLDMRQKVKKKFGTRQPWNMKYRQGGMMDIMFITHYLVLLHAHKHPSLPHPDVAVCLERLMKKKLLPQKTGADLAQNYRLNRDVQSFLRLAAELPFDPAQASAELKTALAENALGSKNFPRLAAAVKKVLPEKSYISLFK